MTEFRGDQVFEGQFPTGKEVLIFYEIEDVNRAHDTITLVGYALFVHLCSFLVLHPRYTLFRSKVKPLSTAAVARFDRLRREASQTSAVSESESPRG